MMKFLKYLLGGIAVVFILVFVISLFLPKTYFLERSIEIEAPAENIFPLIGDLRNWSQWSPWFEMDPEMEVSYGTTTSGVGGSYSWNGEIAGTGSMVIREYEPPDKLSFDLMFQGYEENPSQASITLAKSGAGQTVTWDFSGEFVGNPIQRYFGLMFEGLVGREYEKGLAKLKALVEAE